MKRSKASSTLSLNSSLGFCTACQPLRATEGQAFSSLPLRTLAALTLPFLLVPSISSATDYPVATQEEYDALNNIDFAPGDRILLAGGNIFWGTLYLGPEDSGTDDQGNLIAPIVVTSTGEARATILAGDDPGVYVYNAGGVEISRLNLLGSGVADDGSTTSTSSGLTCYTDSPGNIKYHHIRIDEIEVSGFGHRGVIVGGYNGNSGYDDVKITRVDAHHNLNCGIQTFGFTGSTTALTNVTVSNCSASYQPGDPASTINTGSGIALSGVTGGLIEHCVAHHNGANNQPTEGPVGIWAYTASGVVIQNNESHHNTTSNGDGGGFDLDIGVTHSVLQYNYSHDNAGAGYLTYGKPGSNGNSGNVIRYNVSENDGRDPGSAAASGICVCGNVDDLNVTGNTVSISALPGNTTIPAIKVMETSTNDPDQITISNNIFVTTGGTRLVYQDSDADVVFAGNDYWSSGGSFVIRDNGSTYSSLSSWRSAKDQEKLSGKSTGSTLDPRFNTAGAGDDSLAHLAAFRLRADSPLINKGLNLKSKFGIDAGPRDLFGGPSLQGSAQEIGAHEWATDAPKIIDALPFSHEANGIRIRYQSEIGVSFTVRRSDTPTGNPATDWTPIAPTQLGNGGVMEYVDIPGGTSPCYFYVLVRE